MSDAADIEAEDARKDARIERLVSAYDDAIRGWESTDRAHKLLHECGHWLSGMAACCGLLLGLTVAAFIAPEEKTWLVVWPFLLTCALFIVCGRRVDKLLDEASE